MNFWGELKRRNVFKVAAAYVIVGWLVMQIGEVMAPALHLPDWSLSFMAFVIILGFPLALIFAWAFEMTPEGLKLEKHVDREVSTTRATGQKLNYAIIALLAVALAYFAWDKFVTAPAGDADEAAAGVRTDQPGASMSAPADRKSIAVLPFQNRSANEENAAFFSDGVHDELLTNLAKIGDLKVISRTSVMNYRDTAKNMRQIGEELGVATLLEGGVQRAGDSVRVNVQLIDAATDEHLWAETYDRHLTAENIFAIQSDIALAIAEALQAALSPTEQQLLTAVPTQDLEAYDAFLRATQLFNRGTFESLDEALALAQTATARDPGFTKAYLLTAQIYNELIDTGAVVFAEVGAEMDRAIATAFDQEPSSGTAFAVRAAYLWRGGLEGVQEMFDRALELEPHNATILLQYAEYLRQNLEPMRALELYEAALEYDPVSVHVLFGMGRASDVIGEYEQSRDYFARIRAIDPRNPRGWGPTGGSYLQEGEVANAWLWVSRHLEVDPQDYEIYGWMARAYTDFGDYESAEQWLDWVDANLGTGAMVISTRAMLDALTGRLEQAAATARRVISSGDLGRWGSDQVLTRIVQLRALETGEIEPALELIRSSQPGLLGPEAAVEPPTVIRALNTVQLLQTAGRKDEADRLLAAVFTFLERPFAVTSSIQAWRTTARAEALALAGEKDAAIAELQRVVDSGWRLFWRWETELNPNFASLHDDPRFQSIVAILREHVAAEFEKFKGMVEAGEIPHPPGGVS